MYKKGKAHPTGCSQEVAIVLGQEAERSPGGQASGGQFGEREKV